MKMFPWKIPKFSIGTASVLDFVAESACVLITDLLKLWTEIQISSQCLSTDIFSICEEKKKLCLAFPSCDVDQG